MTVVLDRSDVGVSYEDAERESASYFNGDILAASNFVRKYALRDGINGYLETTPDEMHRRIAREFHRIDILFGGRVIDEDIYFDVMRNFAKVIPQGSPMMGIGGNQNVSLSNCFVIRSPQDNMGDIFRAAEEIAQIQKRRGGVGLDLSELRPVGSPVNNAAVESAGAPCFSDFYSYITRMIGQKGRQGALMITIDIRHPDAARYFVDMKKDKTKVTGANISLLLTDEFMSAVRDNTNFVHRWPIDATQPAVSVTHNARDTFNYIVKTAYECAEPGLIMIDNVRRELPADYYSEFGFRTVSTNPCSELALCPDDSCRLISMNLCGWIENAYGSNAYFDFDSFKDDVSLAMRMSDNLVQLEIEHLTKLISLSDSRTESEMWSRMIDKCRLGRRTGLGTHALGDALAALGVRYASDQAYEVVESIYDVFTNSAYSASAYLAEERGSFPIYDPKLEADCPFIQRLSSDTLQLMEKHGRRNISLLTNAPTGTVSVLSRPAGIAAHGTSSGIEPIFRLRYRRRVKITHSDTSYEVNFVDDNGDKWAEFDVFHSAFHGWLQTSDHPAAKELSGCVGDIKCDDDIRNKVDLPDCWDTSDRLDYRRTVEQQAIIQRYIDHGISRTINMPSNVTMKEVRDVYMDGWLKGLKGVTVYVEGSRDGVLSSKSERPTKLSRVAAPKRPRSLKCDVHRTANGDSWTVLVGLLGNEPYEVFAGKSEDLLIPEDLQAAVITKVGKSRYVVEFEDDGITYRERIRESFVGDAGKQVRLLTNMLLRHGAPIETINHTIAKSTNNVTDFSRVVGRILKKYVKDGKYGYKCPLCGGDIIYKEGCETCESCSDSKCM